jgi:N-acetylneuraminic acid mutarotase
VRLLVLLLPLLLLCACGGGNAAAVDASGLTILPDDLPAGSPRTAYSVTLLGAGGAGRGYAWSLVDGALPPGLVGLPATGNTATLAGTPTLEGTFDFTVELSDSAGAATTMAYSLVVGTDDPRTGPGPGPGSGPGTFPTSLVNAPAPRGYHTAVWTGTEMIVWGGLDPVGPMDTGAAYDPVADTWRTLPTDGAPSARFGHTAVWTGTEMIVWGGSDKTGVLDTGAAYDPRTDTWRAISTANAPERRGGHSAVWTGSAMIVWGGVGVFPRPSTDNLDKVLGDGFAYDPVTDTWTPIAALTGLTARAHCAVWTGASMIVWGGRDGYANRISTQDTGGVYTAATNSWSPTTTTGAPLSRMAHTGVWTGARMVVWGGVTSAFTPPLQTGGRYTPASNSWNVTSTTGAPDARSDHTAVWTGSRMIVWGGLDAAGYLADGGAYDPGADTWTAVPRIAAARAQHTAVWTGTSMIVWGGATSAADTYVDSGAVYTP